MSFLAALASVGVEGALATGLLGVAGGAATGAGLSALMGKDPGMGALMGGVTGGLTGGIGGALSGAGESAATSALSSTAPSIGGSALAAPLSNSAIGSGLAAPLTSTVGEGVTALGASGMGSLGSGLASPLTSTIGAGTTALGSSGLGALGSGSLSSGSGIGLSALQGTAPSALATIPSGPSLASQAIGAWNGLPSLAKMGVVGAGTMGIGSLLNDQPNNGYTPPKQPNSLDRYRYSPNTFMPTFNDGGMVSDQDLEAQNNPVYMMRNGGNVPGRLGMYSDGGSLLRGRGDGVSDGIPALIDGKQQAALASGEFVVPARAVSELGNGDTEAGSARLYKMVEDILNARKKTMDDNYAIDSKAYKSLPS